MVRVTLLAGIALMFAGPEMTFAATQASVSSPEASALSGLWRAKKRFGPDARGPLVIERTATGYVADFMGHRIQVQQDSGELKFELPDLGRFEGRLDGNTLLAHWVVPPSPINYTPTAFPIDLHSSGTGRWTGTVEPYEDSYSFYLLLEPQAGGAFKAVLDNPEFDYGNQLGVQRLEADGKSLKLVGKRAGKDVDVGLGSYDPDNKVMTITFARGGAYEFTRDSADSAFYPRGEKPQRYSYQPPLGRDDGWPVSTLGRENISRAGIEQAVQHILDEPMNVADKPQIHGLLIARHGKLVLEEYFHGEHRDKLHNLRSAAKSLSSVVIGAGIHAGAPLRLSSPVYSVMNNGAFPPGLEAQKREMTLEHLLTMSSGFFCDDYNEQAPGNEDTMLDQTDEPDYYRFTLKVPMATRPGVKAVYCSASPNLALGMLGRATGISPLYSFDKLVARPLKMREWSWPLDPAGNPYGGGSVSLLPRDFVKLGQLMLNGGRWDGRQILDRDYAMRSTSSLYHMAKITYGYLWWVQALPYKNRTVRAFAALGAGGQSLTVIPELDLIVATFGSNYFTPNRAKDTELNLVPRWILPAVLERGDPPDRPVSERDYTSPYGRSPDGSRVIPASRDSSAPVGRAGE